jgi:hypothetical protein
MDTNSDGNRNGMGVCDLILDVEMKWFSIFCFSYPVPARQLSLQEYNEDIWFLSCMQAVVCVRSREYYLATEYLTLAGMEWRGFALDSLSGMHS